jgi:hypothetical protein
MANLHRQDTDKVMAWALAVEMHPAVTAYPKLSRPRRKKEYKAAAEVLVAAAQAALETDRNPKSHLRKSGSQSAR